MVGLEFKILTKLYLGFKTHKTTDSEWNVGNLRIVVSYVFVNLRDRIMLEMFDIAGRGLRFKPHN